MPTKEVGFNLLIPFHFSVVSPVTLNYVLLVVFCDLPILGDIYQFPLSKSIVHLTYFLFPLPQLIVLFLLCSDPFESLYKVSFCHSEGLFFSLGFG